MSKTPTAPVRQRHTRQEIDRIVSAYERGEGTQREIAARHRVRPETLQNWLRRHRELPRPGSGGNWLEVVADVGEPTGRCRIEIGPGRALVLGFGWRAADVRELVVLLSRP